VLRAVRAEHLPWRRRLALFRQHWRDATLADVIAGFRLPEAAWEPAAASDEASASVAIEEVAPIAESGEPSPVASALDTARLALTPIPTEPITPHAIATTASGEVVVLDLARHRVCLLSAKGLLLRSATVADLKAGRRYQIAALSDGQTLVVADEAGATLHRLSWAPDLPDAPPYSADGPGQGPVRALDSEAVRSTVEAGVERWRLPGALLLGAAALGLAFRGQWLTLTPGPQQTIGIPCLVGGVLLFSIAGWLAERRHKSEADADSRQVPGAVRAPEAPAATRPGAGGGIWCRLVALPGRWSAGRQLAAWLDVTPWQLVLLVAALGCSAAAYPLAGAEPTAHRPAAAVVCWLAGLVLAVMGGWKRGPSGSRNPSATEAALVAGLLGLALLLRVTATGHIPYILGGDEGVIGYASVAFADGQANNILNTTLSSPSLYFALQGLAVRVFGHTIEALRFSSVIAGTLAVLAVYWLARTMFGRRAALVSAAYLAAFHFHIHFSRVALQNIWESLFAAIVLAGVWEGWSSNRRSGWLLAGLALGLAQSFFPAVRLLLVVLAAWILYALVRDRQRWWARFPGLVLLGLVFLVAVLPLAWYYVEHPYIYTEPLPRSFILAGQGPAHIHAFGQGQTLSEVLRSQFSAAVRGFTHLPVQDWYTPERPMLLAAPAALFIIGVGYALLRVADLRYALLLILLIGDLVLGVALTTNPPTAQRMVIAVPAVVMLLALPLANTSRWLARFRSGWVGLGQMAVAAALLAIMVVDVHFYFAVYTPGRNYRVANDEIAQRVAEHVDRLSPGGEGWQIYCVCPPRMGYWTHPGMAYLAPLAVGREVRDPLNGPPEWLAPGERALVVFLPERLDELVWVERAYPGGVRVDHWYHNGDLLFATYEVRIPEGL
jgi:hypothetical protein